VFDRQPNIILASSSQSRKKILKELGLSFRAISPAIEERKIIINEPGALVKEISRQKAEAVFKRLAPKTYWLIAADSLAVFKGRILSKPTHKKEAREMLHLLSGQTHHFYTGVCFIRTIPKESNQDYVRTRVDFRELTAEEIEAYVDTQPVTAWAGAYNAAKGSLGEKFLAKIEGSYSNILGLPLEVLLPFLEKYEIKYKKPSFL